MAITVRFKPTGELGTIPEQEYDPSIYEQVDNQPKGNLLTDILSYATRPFTNTAKKVGAVTETAGLYASSPAFRKQLRGDKLTSKEVKELASYKPMFEQTARNQTVGQQAVETGKDLAGLASYAVPFGKGAGIVQKAILPGAVASGLLETNQPKSTVSSVVKAGVAGGVTGGALYGLGKLFSGLKGGLKRVGESTIQSQYNVPRSAARSMKIRETVQKLSDYGINNIDDITPAAERVTGSNGVLSRIVRDAAGQADDVPTNGLIKIAQNIADDPSIQAGQDKKLFEFFKKGIKSLYDTTGNKPPTGGNPLQVLDYIRTLEGKAAGITRGRASYMITDAEKALANSYLSFADELSGRLFQQAGADKIAVNLAQNPQILAELAKVSPKLAEAASKATSVSQLRSLAAPFVRGAKLVTETEAGRNLATNTAAGAVTGLGKLVQNPLNLIAVPLSTNTVNATLGGAIRSSGNLVPQVAEKALTNPAVVNTGSRIGGMLGNILSAGQPQETNQQDVLGVKTGGNEEYTYDPQIGTYVSRDGQWAWDGQQWVQNPTAQQTQSNIPSQEIFQQALINDLMAGGKNVAKIKAVMDVFYPNSKMTATQQKRLATLNMAEGIYNTVEKLALEAPTGLYGYGRAKIGKLPGVEGGAAEDLERTTQALAKGIAGALASEVGVATDKDIERWMGLMPKVTDTMAERKRALERLKSAIIASREQLNVPQEEQTQYQYNIGLE